MKDRLFAEIDRLKSNMIEDLISLINIPSVKSKSSPGAPYGENCRKVLDKALSICDREGLNVKNIDGHMGYASYGCSDDYIGMIGHLDVVHEGNLSDWICNPYEGKIIENRMYARGALDNKGPSIAALYGLLALKNLGIEPKRQIRMIFGTDEESGMSDIEYYLKKEAAPVLGFTPDNKFPAIYGERGRANIKIYGSEADLYIFINKYIIDGDREGNKLEINYEDENFGKMIIKGLKIYSENNIKGISMQLSLPECNIEDIIAALDEKAKNLTVELVNYYDIALKNPKSTNVIVLNRAYNEITKEDINPNTTTGMTYAHKCPNIIGYGPSFPGQNGIAHLPNEWFDIDDLILCSKIYAYGLYNLSQIDEIIE